MKLIQKISLILLLVVLTMSCCATASALEITWSNFDGSNVLDDLKNSTIAGENFDPDDYQYTDERELKVLSFVEYGFGVKDTSHYGLYVYVYNPTGVAIQSVSSNNVTVATTYNTKGEATDYVDFELRLLSASEGKYAHLFYKFKLKNPSKLLTRVQAHANKRRYDVSEIELRFAGSYGAEAFSVANYWEYSGYARGLGADPEAESTLECTSDRIETLKLDVHSAFYVYNNDEDVKSDVMSVYFGVPEEIFEKYGTLQQIKANWYMTFTDMQYFVFNKSYYNFLEPYIKYDGALIPIQNFIDNNNKTPKNIDSFINGNLVGLPIEDKYGPDQYGGFRITSGNLHWLFDTGGEEFTVTADEVAEYAKWYTEKFGGDLLLDKYNKYLFLDVDNYGSTYRYKTDNGIEYTVNLGWQGDNGAGIVIDADETFDLNGFEFGEKSKLVQWWKRLIYDYSGMDYSTLENISPIHIVKDAEVTSNATMTANNLLIDKSEVDKFKTVYETNTLQNKKTVLFRFAVTPYYTSNLMANYSSISAQRIGYKVQQAVALDFDIIWLKFVDKDVETIIPAVSKPVDIFSGVDDDFMAGVTPNPTLIGSGKKTWEKILKFLEKYWWTIPAGIAGFVLAVTLGREVLALVLKGLLWLICAPFKAIAKALKRGK